MRTYTPVERTKRVEQMRNDRYMRLDAIERKLPFIDPDFNPFFEITQGMILIGAESGKGKSSTLANLVAGFLLHAQPTDEAIVITNEETTEAVCARVACIMLQKSFFRYYQGKLSAADEKAVVEKAEEVAARVEIVENGAFDMTCMEDVQSVLVSAARRKVRLVAIDYLQTITTSRARPQAEPVQVSKSFGLYLKAYAKSSGIPVIVFAQLKPESESGDISSRFQNDRTIYNHAFAVLEIVPDFKNRTSKFILYKDRFGPTQRAEITASFEYGRFKPVMEI